LHELGHGVGLLLKLNNNPNVIDAHKRLYWQINIIFPARRTRRTCGREELLTESFADYFILSKSKFIKKYDEDWRSFLGKIIVCDSIN